MVTAAAPRAARTATCAPPRVPSGRAEDHRATSATHATRTRVGRCASPATGPPTNPAGIPAAIPHAITGPAAGTASRLAGSVATGSRPNTGTSTGATPACAARVTPTAVAIGRGPGRARAMGRASRTIPVHAATDRRNPTDPSSSGSTSNNPAIASASRRSAVWGRPVSVAVMASAAIASARSTDGSQRVTAPNSNSTNRPAKNRARSPSRDSTGWHKASRKATFSPETTSRWVRPAPRKSSTTSGG